VNRVSKRLWAGFPQNCGISVDTGPEKSWLNVERTKLRAGQTTPGNARRSRWASRMCANGSVRSVNDPWRLAHFGGRLHITECHLIGSLRLFSILLSGRLYNSILFFGEQRWWYMIFCLLQYKMSTTVMDLVVVFALFVFMLVPLCFYVATVFRWIKIYIFTVVTRAGRNPRF